MKPLQIVGGAYQSRSLPADAQRLINLYVEVDKAGGFPAVLLGTPGTVPLYMTQAAEGRGLWAMNGDTFAVVGDKVYRNGGVIGSLNSVSGPVSMADNGTQLMIVDGVAGYILSGGSLTQISDEEFPNGVKVVVWQGQYFVVGVDGTQQFFISSLTDGSKWDGLDFASAEQKPDKLVSMAVSHDRLLLFGEYSTEQWVNTGNPLFPFERDNGSSMEVGCESTFSVQAFNNGVYWLGRDKAGGRMAFAAQGGIPQRISHHGIEREWATYARVDDAYSLSYQQEGHSFWCVTFPTAERTWVYDVATQLWHERAYWNADLAVYSRWRPVAHAYVNGQNVVLDYATGQVCALSLDEYTDCGDMIRRLRTTAPSQQSRELIAYAALELDIEAGPSETVSDPKVMMRYSNDGARSWGIEREARIGKVGETMNRTRWLRCGIARERVWEISVSDPVKVAIKGAYVEAK